MGTTKKADLMINNGTDYDKILFSTTAEQVEFANTDGTTSNLQTKVSTLSGKLEIEEVSSAYALANAATGSIVAYKMGSVVFLSGDITLPSTYTTDSAFLFATTTTLRPKKNEFISAMRGTSGATGTACRVQIGSNGYLQAYCPAGSSWSMRFSAVYII